MKTVKSHFQKALLLGLLAWGSQFNPLQAFTLSGGGSNLPQMTLVGASQEYRPTKTSFSVSSGCTAGGTGTYTWQVYDIFTSQVYNEVYTASTALPGFSIEMVARPEGCQSGYSYSRTVGLRVIKPNATIEYFTGSALVFNYKTAGAAIGTDGLYLKNDYSCPSVGFNALPGKTCVAGGAMSFTSVTWYAWNGSAFATAIAGPYTSGAGFYTPSAYGKIQARVTSIIGGVSYTEAVEYNVQAITNPVIEVTGCGGCTSAPYTPGMTISVNATSAEVYQSSPASPWFTQYQWYRNGQIIPGANSNSYNPLNQGRYYFIATGPCGTYTSNTVTVTAAACTSLGGYQAYGISGGTVSLPSGTYSGNIFIKGTIRLNSGALYNFNTANVIFEECASIIVENTSTLRIINSTLSSCSQWAGITVTPNCTLLTENSDIMHAFVAVKMEDKTLLSTQTTDYVNNRVSIAIMNKSGGPQHLVDQCNFSSMDRLNGLPCNVSKMGASFNNIFAYIYTHQSYNAAINNSNFFGWAVNTFPGPWDVDPELTPHFYGILHERGGGNFTYYENNFYDIFRAGIRVDGSVNLYIDQQHFIPLGLLPVQNAGRGILFKDNASLLTVVASEFKSLYSGILETDKNLAMLTDISSNTFEDNFYGLQANNTRYLKFATNTLDNINIGSGVGVEMIDCKEIRIKENMFFNMLFGIHATESMPYSIIDNLFDGGVVSNSVGIAVYKEGFLAGDDFSKIGSNNFSRLDAGLIIAPQQDPRTAPNTAANAQLPGSVPQKVIFICNNFELCNYGIIGSSPLADQFTDVSSGTNYDALNSFNGNYDWDLIWENSLDGGTAFIYYSPSSTPYEPNITPSLPGVVLNGAYTNFFWYLQSSGNPSGNCSWEPDFIAASGGVLFKNNVSTGVAPKTETLNSILVKPTLVENMVNISNPDGLVQQVQVISITGQELLNTQLPSAQELDLANLTPGVYLIRVQLENGITHTQRIVKQ